MKISLSLIAGTHKRWVCSSNPASLITLSRCFSLLQRAFPTVENLLQVKFEQGIQVLKIFKNHSSKTTILDDFGFYEARQRTMQEKKAKQQLFQKQARILVHFLFPLSNFYPILLEIFNLHFNTFPSLFLRCFYNCLSMENIVFIWRQCSCMVGTYIFPAMI